MYVDESLIREAERRFGKPGEKSFRVETSDAELAFIRSTQKRGRCHDVTILIRRDDAFAVISKHDYPAGAFRPPSGGLEPGESLEAGARREAHEETGLDVRIERYVLRARVTFAPAPGSEAAAIDWVSHVFEAESAEGELCPIDRHEIAGAAWIRRDELVGQVRAKLLEKDAAGIRYRVALHDAIFAEIDRRTAGEGNS